MKIKSNIFSARCRYRRIEPGALAVFSEDYPSGRRLLGNCHTSSPLSPASQASRPPATLRRVGPRAAAASAFGLQGRPCNCTRLSGARLRCQGVRVPFAIDAFRPD